MKFESREDRKARADILDLAARLTAAEDRIGKLEWSRGRSDVVGQRQAFHDANSQYSGEVPLPHLPTRTKDATPDRKQEMVRRYIQLIEKHICLDCGISPVLALILSDLIDEARRS